jgi:biopolymer transport protein ExbD
LAQGSGSSSRAGSPASGNPLGRILAVYRDSRDAEPEALELKLDEAILREVPRLEGWQGAIKVIAAVAPLLGLLGTVTGMIATFQAITLFGTGDPKLMAGGISQALVTTVLGLSVAIPLVLLHSVVASRSKALIEVLEEQSAGIIARQAERRRMNLLPEAFAAIRDFMEAGGNVLYGILFVTVLMWTFILERLWFFFVAAAATCRAGQAGLGARSDTSSWYARQIRAEEISRIRLECQRYLPLVKTLMVVLPLLGLLGTVTGMISVFEVMALSGHRQRAPDGGRRVQGDDPDDGGPGRRAFGAVFRDLAGEEGERERRASRTCWYAGEGRGRMRRKRRHGGEEAEINITPMLDIVFIMLIFFIVTTSFVKEIALDLNRPSSEPQEEKRISEVITIRIQANGQVEVGNRPVDIRAVRANVEGELATRGFDTPVVVIADRAADSGLMVRVIDQARMAGADKVSLAAMAR